MVAEKSFSTKLVHSGHKQEGAVVERKNEVEAVWRQQLSDCAVGLWKLTFYRSQKNEGVSGKYLII